MATKPRSKQRDLDELEGTLLPPLPPPPPPPTDLIPLATVVSSESASPSAPPLSASVTAVPIEHFEYEYSQTEAAVPTRQDTTAAGAAPRRVAGTVMNDKEAVGDAAPPAAPLLPRYDDRADAAKERSDSERLRVANAVGLSAADSEITDIERARGRIYAAQYGERERVRAANKEAQRRDREGLRVRDDKYFRVEGLEQKGKRDDGDVVAYGKKCGGYEVSEYETSDYETSDYTCQEYKSVYDP